MISASNFVLKNLVGWTCKMTKHRQTSRVGEEGEHLGWDLIAAFGYPEMEETSECYFQSRISQTKAMTVKQKVFIREACKVKHDRNEFVTQI